MFEEFGPTEDNAEKHNEDKQSVSCKVWWGGKSEPVIVVWLSPCHSIVLPYFPSLINQAEHLFSAQHSLS